MKEPRFGSALSEELRRPQRFAHTDPARHLPFANLCEPGYPKISFTETALYVILAALIVALIAAPWIQLV